VTVYILMYFTAVLFALSISTQKSKFIWTGVGLLLVIIIGWRHEVGGDWNSYLRNFEHTSYLTYSEVLKGEDPGYYLINLFMSDNGYEIYAVNFISAIFFVIGLIKMVRRQFNPWLALAAAIPYLVIVVSMGYTRQGVAIGFVMWAIVALDEKKFIWFLVLIGLAASFHKSAVLMVGIGMFGQGANKWLRILAIGFVGIGIYGAFLEEHQERLWENYVDAQMESQGAKIRAVMNFIPAVLFLMLRNEWKKYYTDYTFWRIIALGSVGALFLVGFASTAVDRMALYMIPLQLVVFGRLPFLMRYKIHPQITTLLVLLYYMAVLFVWLNFATHAQYWLPYENYLWYDLF